MTIESSRTRRAQYPDPAMLDDDGAKIINGAPVMKEPEPLKATHADDIGPEMKPPPQVVEDLACEGDVITLFGTSQAGKTTLAAHLAQCVALGIDFLGLRVRAGPVVYIAAEVPGNVMRRIQGAKQHFGFGHMPLTVVRESVDLFEGLADVARIVAFVKTFATQCGEPVKMVIVDTLARCTCNGDENSTHDMGIVMRHLTHIAEATHAAVIVVHHTGNADAGRSRGSSVIYSNADGEIICEHDKSQDIRTLTIKKQRNLGTDGLKLAARFVRVDVGVDEWGKPLTASAVEPAELPQQAAKLPQASGVNQKIALDVLGAPLRKSKTFGKGGAPPMWPCLELEEAVRIVAASLTCEEKRRSERARAAVGGLVANGVFGSSDGWVWRK